MKRLLYSLVLSLLCVIAAAQTAVVTRNVNLRPDASTDNDPIEGKNIVDKVTDSGYI